MKKNPLTEKIAASADIDEVAAGRAINIILSGIVEGLRQSGQVSLGDLGAFKISTNAKFNPNQPVISQKHSKTALRFIPSSKLRKAINEAK